MRQDTTQVIMEAPDDVSVQWGAAKDKVYKARPRTLEALKRQVTEYVQQVPLATCRKVGDNFKVRVAACRRRRGGHIEHISYHKLAGF